MRFIEAYPQMRERGAVSQLAARLKISPSAISQWRRVPAEHVTEVAAFTGVTPEVLRPDVFKGRAA